ncbi:MAG TPA: PH domain-containing protein [Rhodanobacter sp.]|nr:PH domain-containing protein [Rhodanobacter sp.]
MDKHYPAAPWSGFLKGISIVVTLLLLGISWLLASIMPTHTLPLLRTVATVLPLLILLAAVPFVVRGYELRDGTLQVHRLGWTTRVALGELRGAAIDPHAGADSIRLLGNGGLFSFSGWFRNAKLGRYRAFVTDWQRAVVLHGAACTVVLSPADPASFVRALQTAAAPTATASRKSLPRWRQSRR